MPARTPRDYNPSMLLRLTTALCLAIAAIALAALASGTPADARHDPNGAKEKANQPRLRHPVALAFAGGRLFTANRRAGSVSVVNADRMKVVEEVNVGGLPSDLAATPDGRSLLLANESAGEIVRLAVNKDGSPRVAGHLRVGTSPVGVRVAPDGSFCTIALLWPRRVAVVAIESGGDDATGGLRLLQTIDLPFSPRLQWIQGDGRLLVAADAFGGNLAAIDLPAGTVRALRSVHGHNLRGLAARPGRRDLLLAHEMMEESIPTTRDQVFWGNVMSGVLRTVSLNHLLEPPPAPRHAVKAGTEDSAHAQARTEAAPIAHWSLYPLGESGRGAGDPGAVAVTPGGQTVVCLSGVDEVAVQPAPAEEFRRLPVGRRPAALAVAPDGRRVFVANTFDDSLSVVDLSETRVVATVSLGPRPPLTPADKGESLFHDARLSLDGWYSCHSCHTDGHSNGLLNDNFSDGSFGTPKRILSLGGTGDTGPWAWDGSNATLADQIHKSITGTMQGKPERATDENVEAIAAYLRHVTPAAVGGRRPRRVGRRRGGEGPKGVRATGLRPLPPPAELHVPEDLQRRPRRRGRRHPLQPPVPPRRRPAQHPLPRRPGHPPRRRVHPIRAPRRRRRPPPRPRRPAGVPPVPVKSPRIGKRMNRGRTALRKARRRRSAVRTGNPPERFASGYAHSHTHST